MRSKEWWVQAQIDVLSEESIAYEHGNFYKNAQILKKCLLQSIFKETLMLATRKKE